MKTLEMNENCRKNPGGMFTKSIISHLLITHLPIAIGY